MMTRKILVVPGLLALVTSASATAEEIAFPEDFRMWTHIRSAVAKPVNPAFSRFEGTHSIYANPTALEGYRTGRFPDGSVIVFDNHETLAVQGAQFPGKRKFVDVMAKAGGSWRFGEFTGDSKTERSVTVAQGQTQCAACHTSAPTDHVFSRFTP